MLHGGSYTLYSQSGFHCLSSTVTGVLLTPTGASRARAETGGADRAEPDRPQGLDQAELRSRAVNFLMSAHQEVAALATTVAAQAELISQLTARVEQLEKQMKRVPCEGTVQQLVGDSVDFLMRKRPRPSGSDDSDSDSDSGDFAAARSAQHLSFACVGCEAQGQATGIDARTVRACEKAIEERLEALEAEYETDFEDDDVHVEVDVDVDEDPETSANAVRCTLTGQHRGLGYEDCVDILSKVLVRQGVFEG